MHAQHKDAQLRLFLVDLLDQLDAAAARHRHVEQEHLEFQFAHARERLGAVARFGNDFQLAGFRKHLFEAFANDRMIVRNDDADHD